MQVELTTVIRAFWRVFGRPKRYAVVPAAAVLAVPQFVAALPLHYGIGGDYQAGPSGALWGGATAFAYVVPARGDASAAVTRYDDSAVGPGWSTAVRAAAPLRGSLSLRASGAVSAADQGWNAWNFLAGPEVEWDATTLSVGYHHARQRGGHRSDYVVLTAARSLSPALHAEAGLAVGTNGDEPAGRGTVLGAWSRNRFLLFAGASLGAVASLDGSSVVGGATSGSGRANRRPTRGTSDADAPLTGATFTAGVRYTIR